MGALFVEVIMLTSDKLIMWQVKINLANRCCYWWCFPGIAVAANLLRAWQPRGSCFVTRWNMQRCHTLYCGWGYLGRKCPSKIFLYVKCLKIAWWSQNPVSIFRIQISTQMSGTGEQQVWRECHVIHARLCHFTSPLAYTYDGRVGCSWC